MSDFTKQIFLIIFFYCIFSNTSAQLVVNSGGMTPTQYVENVLLGGGITASNVSFQGTLSQLGTFNAFGTNPFLGITNGLIIATANATVAEGPNIVNTSTGGGDFFSTDLDLEEIINNSVDLHDAAILEFDFIPNGEELSFKFIFGSEEYLDYVNAGYNDVFGFFLSGPGIAGSFTNNAKNIAVLPGTTTPVTIDNVNDSLNSAYYIDNEINTGNTSIQFDGYTTSLEVYSEVLCGETYHIKIAIADAGDDLYESGVFLEAGSFVANTFELTSSVDINSSDSVLYEGCGSAELEFTRGNSDNAASMTYSITGTANSNDYTVSTNTVNFAAGQSSASVLFSAVFDSLNEPLETVSIQLIQTICNLADTQSVSFLIGDVYAPEVTTKDTSIQCNSTGQVPIWIDVNDSLYTVSWETGEITDTILVSPTQMTSYMVTVTDKCGIFSVVDSVVVGIVDGVEISISSSSTNCGQSNAFISATITGGVSPYSILWDDPNSTTGLTLTSILAGSYNLQIEAANGCTLDTTVVIEDISGPSLSLSNSSNVLCNGDCTGKLEATITGGFGFISINWMNETINAPLSQFDDSDQIMNLCPGDYSITITDQGGCSETGSQTIIEPDELISIIGNSNDAICFGESSGSAEVLVSGGVSPYSYLWDDLNIQTTALVGLSGGFYTVTVSDINNCIVNSSVLINSPSAINVLVNKNDVKCKSICDGSISLFASEGAGSFDYVWDSFTSNTPNQSSLCAGVYLVSVVDQNGCVLPLSVTLTEPDTLIAFISMTSTFCSEPNGSVNVHSVTGGVSPYVYSWSPTSQSSSQVFNLLAGIYTVQVTDVNNCLFTESIEITDQPAPIIQSLIVEHPKCFGSSDGSLTPTVISGTTPFTYQWDDRFNQTGSVGQSLTSGTYCLTVSDFNGCTAVECRTLIEPSELTTQAIGSTQICYGEETIIYGIPSGGTPSYTINWINQPSWINSVGPFEVSPQESTNYCFIATDSRQCSKTDCVNIIVPSALTVTSGLSNTICIGDEIEINVSGSGGQNESNYCFTWTSSDVTCGESNSEITVSPTDTTIYRVILSDKCSKNDTGFYTVNVTEKPVAVFAPLKSSGCPPLEIDFFANSSVINSTFSWDFDSDGIVDTSVIVLGGNHNSQKWLYHNSGVFGPTLTLTSEGGCSTSAILKDVITVLPMPSSEIIANPTKTTLVNSNVDFDGSNSLSYSGISWDFGDGSTAVGEYTSHNYSDTGDFIATLTTINGYGCINQATVELSITADHILYTPNAFSPNGDGINDDFFPLGVGFTNRKLEFYVYNRWGQKVFESHNIEDRWDGRSKSGNSYLEAGVYLWKIKAFDFYGKEIIDVQTVGTVTLIK